MESNIAVLVMSVCIQGYYPCVNEEHSQRGGRDLFLGCSNYQTQNNMWTSHVEFITFIVEHTINDAR